jgi:adhesin HecA-like repeat protein
MLGANGHLNIFSPIYSSGPMTLQAGGDVTIGGPSSSFYADIFSSDALNIVAGNNLNVLPSSYGYSSYVSANGITTIITGGNVLVDQSMVSGNPDVVMKVGGVVNINGTLAYGGGISASTPQTIHLEFVNGTSGGFFVNGIEGVVFDPATNTGFFANGDPAVLGSTLLVTYSGNPVSTPLTVPTENLIIAMGESTEPPDPEKDKDVFEDIEEKKKKEAPVCR